MWCVLIFSPTLLAAQEKEVFFLGRFSWLHRNLESGEGEGLASGGSGFGSHWNGWKQVVLSAARIPVLHDFKLATVQVSGSDVSRLFFSWCCMWQFALRSASVKGISDTVCLLRHEHHSWVCSWLFLILQLSWTWIWTQPLLGCPWLCWCLSPPTQVESWVQVCISG